MARRRLRLAGALLNAAVTYRVGRWLRRDTVRRLAGQRLNRITRRLARRGVLAIVILRLLPIAPFTMVNAVAGASRIRADELLIGTAIGIAPGIALTMLFVDWLSGALADPGLWHVLCAGGGQRSAGRLGFVRPAPLRP